VRVDIELLTEKVGKLSTQVHLLKGIQRVPRWSWISYWRKGKLVGSSFGKKKVKKDWPKKQEKV